MMKLFAAAVGATLLTAGAASAQTAQPSTGPQGGVYSEHNRLDDSGPSTERVEIDDGVSPTTIVSTDPQAAHPNAGGLSYNALLQSNAQTPSSTSTGSTVLSPTGIAPMGTLSTGGGVGSAATGTQPSFATSWSRPSAALGGFHAYGSARSR